MKKLALHWKILIGMVLGVIWSILASHFGLIYFTNDWISPFGTIFINMLKMIAVPLVLVSLIDGVSNLKDISKLSRIGTKTIAFYLGSTVVAVTIGLLLVNIIQPGKAFSPERQAAFKEQFAGDMSEKALTASQVKGAGPLQFLVDIVPENLFFSLGNNSAMLQVIFFALLFGIALIMIPKEKSAPVKAFFDGANAVILKIVDFIMFFAPYGVFALLASLKIDMETLTALGLYSLTVIIGLAIMILLVYSVLVTIFTKLKYTKFLKGILPAQLLAFSTSSSAATLPVTMDRVEKHLGVSEEVSSFVLPLGATINMDGTSLYQAVAAVFIAQAFGFDLTIAQQLTIVLTATLASIGSAAVPGAGMVMLIIVLESVGLDPEGIALIVAVDRLLDMCRTTVNVTGDATVATLVAGTEGEIMIPEAERVSEG